MTRGPLTGSQTTTAPGLPPEIPRRGNALSYRLGRFALRLLGWRIRGEIPNLPKIVAIVAPHTSNWDFIVGVAALFTLGVQVTFLGKDSLFRPPFGGIFRWLGGVPVDRSSHHDVVEQTVEEFNRREHMIIALAPEGTRKKVERWHTGFYYIAVGAGAAILPVAFDWRTRTIRFGEPVMPTGDFDADTDVIGAFYAGAEGRRRELATIR